jgi:anti-sigma regulatory factor (Ser/Thr protein kinase)
VTGVRPPEPLHLAPEGPASAQARAYVRTALLALGRPALLDSAELGVTELVTNACLHARTPFTLSIRAVEHGVRIGVTDHSPRAPEIGRGDLWSTTGRGLRLLEGLGRWGVDLLGPPEVGKTVWFEPIADPATADRASASAGVGERAQTSPGDAWEMKKLTS